MRLKIEFTASRSHAFPHVLRLCKKIATYQERTEDGAALHSVEFEEPDFQSAYAIIERVRGWHTATYYIDGVLTPTARAGQVVYDVLWQQRRAEATEAFRREQAQARAQRGIEAPLPFKVLYQRRPEDAGAN